MFNFVSVQISAHFQTFVAYSGGSQSIVLMHKFGDDGASAPPLHQPPLRPTIHRALQFQSVISVVLGDYHFGALTAAGKLLPWGAYSIGALGLGSPIDIPAGQPGGFRDEEIRSRSLRACRWFDEPLNVQEPTEVNFSRGGKKRETFCFAAAAAGWHSGALVINLDVSP